MKLTTGIVALAITAGTAWGQNPTVLTNTKNALQAAPQTHAATAKPAAASPAKPAATSQPASKPTVTATPAKSTPPAKKSAPAVKIAAAPAKAAPAKKAAVPVKAAAAAPKPEAAPADADAAKAEQPQQTKYSMTGRRDPFISPVVSRAGGSGCSTGKKCLDIEQIALRGVVRSDAGMIAVVTNGLNKAYFLRENDPVFNGYVVKITGDSVVFKETFQDRLGKPFTKDVVKKITTPAV
jgi:Tfp pilus assembly protein PilP